VIVGYEGGREAEKSVAGVIKGKRKTQEKLPIRLSFF
jgi:hypothetical protein